MRAAQADRYEPLPCLALRDRSQRSPEGQQRLTRAMRDPQRDVSTLLVGQHVDPAHVANASRQMAIGIAKLAEHELHASIVLVVGRAKQRIVMLLCLCPDLGIIDLEDSAPA